jgi:hypothetical protein
MWMSFRQFSHRRIQILNGMSVTSNTLQAALQREQAQPAVRQWWAMMTVVK